MHPAHIDPGTVVGIPASVAGGALTVQHMGIVSDHQDEHGLPLVISASKKTGRVSEETWLQFTGGQDATIYDFLGSLPGDQVVRRARSKLGTRWDLLVANCEHFVHWAHGLDPQSPQLQSGAKAVAWVAVVAGVMALAVKAINDSQARA
ncbi:MAG: hypothetical protein GXP62_04215 [Oligoflexia bacterium]|nr:hypothetical protein [Oligoflexia bacterium]